MKRQRHGAVTALLHWAHGALVLTLFALGWVMLNLPKGPDKAQMFALHKSLGLCALALLALRFAWHRKHRLVAADHSWMARAAAMNQRLLYLLLFLTPSFGAISTAFGKHPLRLFALELPHIVAINDTLHELFALMHRLSGWLLAACIAAHLVAAIHHTLARDGKLGRMPPLPAGKSDCIV